MPPHPSWQDGPGEKLASNPRRNGLIGLLLVAACLWTYWPVRGFQFLNYDDPEYVTENRHVLDGLSWPGAAWAFDGFHESNWHPLTWLSHMLDCQLFGQRAGCHHLVNLGLHCLNTLLLFGLFRRLTGAAWRSGLVAGLFALHPLHVESVAWVAERKDVLSTFLGLLTLWAYGCYARRSQAKGLRSKACYGLALLGFGLALLSKPMLVTLPGVMLLLDYWPLKRLPGQPGTGPPGQWLGLLAEKLPFVLLSAGSGIITWLAQNAGGSVVGIRLVPLPARLANVAVAYVAYLQKTFWPANLAVFYPYPQLPPYAPAALALAGLLAVSVAAWTLGKRAPYLRMGWLWYLGTLVPAIGLVQVGGQAMADRYTYLPLVGIFVLVVWGMADLLARVPAYRVPAAGVGCAALVACAGATRHQLAYWHDSELLFRHALEVAPDNNLTAHLDLGEALCARNDLSGALEQFQEVVQLQPQLPLGELDLANTLALAMRLDEARPHYEEAIRLNPNYAQAYKGLASTLALQGRFAEARTNFLAALRCKPDYAEAHTLLGNLLLLEGGSPAEALQHLQQAVRIRPDYAEGQYYLAGALARAHRFPEAAIAFRAAIKADPRYSNALNDLAWLLATSRDQALRNIPEAIQDAQYACTLTGYTNASYLDTLAVAQGEAGHLSEATRLTQQALALATHSADAAVLRQLQQHLLNFQAGRSYSQRRELPSP